MVLGQDEPVNLPCQAPIINDNDLIILVDYAGEILAVAKDAVVLSALRPFKIAEVAENPPKRLHFWAPIADARGEEAGRTWQ